MGYHDQDILVHGSLLRAGTENRVKELCGLITLDLPLSDLYVCVTAAGPASVSRGSYWPMRAALPAFREVNVNGKV